MIKFIPLTLSTYMAKLFEFEYIQYNHSIAIVSTTDAYLIAVRNIIGLKIQREFIALLNSYTRSVSINIFKRTWH